MSLDQRVREVLASIRILDWLYGLMWLAVLGAVLRGVIRNKSLTDLDFVAVLIGFLVCSLLALNRSTRLLACVAIITTIVPLYAFELYLRMGSSKVEFTQELRRQGIAAYPLVSPNAFMDLWLSVGDEDPITVEDREILPLAGIPDSPTVYCQADDGAMIVYQSDSFGFRNAESMSSKQAPELALLGDSFVHGYCVPNEQTYAAHLQVLGSTTSFGMDGTSVVAQLAIYQEYIQRLEVQRLVWFFYEGNDLQGFLEERKRPPLNAYLAPTYLQDLAALNDAISLATKRYIDDQLMLRVGGARLDDEMPFVSVMSDLLFLRKTRMALLGPRIRRLGEVVSAEIPPSISETEWREIAEMWRRVITLQRKHGGDVILVYIPTNNRYAAADPAVYLDLEKKVLEFWRELDVDHLSLTDALAGAENPRSLYSGIHFTEDGYEFTAKYLIDHLGRLTGS